MTSVTLGVFAFLALGQEPAVSLAGDFGEPKLIVPAPKDPDLAYLAWPKVTRTAKGTLVVAYVAGRFHGTHGGGCPAVSISTDGGKTFSAPQVLKRYGPGKTYTSGGNVALGLADDGALVLLSMAFRGDEANTIDAWRSTDEGRTWMEADASRLEKNRTGSVYGHVLRIPGKGLAVVGHFRKGSTTQPTGLWWSLSTDGGRSWGDPQAITRAPLVEPAFVFARGRFLGLARPAATPAWYTLATSADLGRSWKIEPKGLVLGETRGVRFPSPGLFTDPDDPDRLLALVSQRFTPEGNKDLYGRIDVVAGKLDGSQWRPLGTLARFPRTLGERKDLTYGWMTPLGDRRWYAVFYCGRTRGASDIFGWEFEMPAGK